MNFSPKLKPPSPAEKKALRVLIILGLLSLLHFFYWFLDFDLINNEILYILLLISISFDSLRLIFIWYHYWDISIPKPLQKTSSLTVDVFTTYFPGEPYSMITETLHAIKKIDYPHTTYLCDEGNDSYLKNFCLEHDIIHVTRKDRKDAKAGNINNALKIAKGEICLILDPDHIPSTNFLDVVVPYFEDESIGFVQTVQTYYNAKESLVADGAAEQTYHFYGPVMMTMNSYGTVNAIGANCVFRRRALDSIGGHAAGLSEDLHTAMQLHAKKWKSVYVPEVLTQGLAPDTLTAYYKQQLKWSRGTLELLFSVYPKLFKFFTLRQKLHYAILPLHYLSGIIILINFLIPIVALLSATTPWKGNMVNFTFLILPVVLSIFTIRIYVQKWVMKKSEYGIHLTGGLLFISAWWIYILGFVYTLIRKKIPYIPTPKDGNARISYKLLLPNIGFGLLSLFAVVYGLSIDLTPFSVTMSFFALLNSYFLFYTLWFQYEKKYRGRHRHSGVQHIRTKLAHLKHGFYDFWRKFAVQMSLLLIVFFAASQYYIEYLKFEGISTETALLNQPVYLGVFYPSEDNGISNNSNVSKLEKEFSTQFDIVSSYIPWTFEDASSFSNLELDTIYKKQAIAMITWEPWLPESFKNPNNLHVFELIVSGKCDAYILNFAKKLKTIDKPVLLRFAHEFDNPFYPWYVNDTHGFEQFKAAWKHIVHLFNAAQVDNIRWVWNPWKPENIDQSYPGDNYVDWVGVNILNYEDLNDQQKSASFKELYTPYKDALSKLTDLPVIIAELGSLGHSNKERLDWIKDAFSKISDEPNIKAAVLFYSNLDDNTPLNSNYDKVLNWTFNFNPGKELDSILSRKRSEPSNPITKPLVQQHIVPQKRLNDVVGVNLNKGGNWRKSYHILNKRQLWSDFKRMKTLGITSIRYQDNSVYNYNVLKETKRSGVQISFGFDIPSDMNWVYDDSQKEQLRNHILKTVKKLRHHNHILNWHFETDILNELDTYFPKIDVPIQRYAYLNWVNRLITDIKIMDNYERPVILDLNVSASFSNRLNLIKDQIPELNMIGLIVEHDSYLPTAVALLNEAQLHYQYSQISSASIIAYNIHKSGATFYIKAWQDNHEFGKLSFNGLLDIDGSFKKDYYLLKDVLKEEKTENILPHIKILRPAKLLYTNQIHTYRSMVLTDSDNWVYGDTVKNGQFEWSLIKCDKNGTFSAIKTIGNKADLTLKIPENWEHYRIQLRISNHKMTHYITTRLNTPLQSPKKQLLL